MEIDEVGSELVLVSSDVRDVRQRFLIGVEELWDGLHGLRVRVVFAADAEAGVRAIGRTAVGVRKRRRGASVVGDRGGINERAVFRLSDVLEAEVHVADSRKRAHRGVGKGRLAWSESR